MSPLVDNKESATLDNITIISHATRKPDHNWNYYGDPNAADYVHAMAQHGQVALYELGDALSQSRGSSNREPGRL